MYRDQTDNALSDSPLLSDVQSDYQSIGLEALEMLHNQLQILVSATCTCTCILLGSKWSLLCISIVNIP